MELNLLIQSAKLQLAPLAATSATSPTASLAIVADPTLTILPNSSQFQTFSPKEQLKKKKNYQNSRKKGSGKNSNKEKSNFTNKSSLEHDQYLMNFQQNLSSGIPMFNESSNPPIHMNNQLPLHSNTIEATKESRATRSNYIHREHNNHNNPTSASSLKEALQQYYPNMDPRLLELSFPSEQEHAFATAIFELGLKHSSPKILIPLLPNSLADLSTEHIKSHLQKYRIHQKRSKEEFESFFKTYIQEDFQDWEKNREWESIPVHLTKGTNNSNSNSSSNDSSQGIHRTSLNNSRDSLVELDSKSHHNNDNNLEGEIRNAAFVDDFWNEGQLHAQKSSPSSNNNNNQDEEDEPVKKIRKLQHLKQSLTETLRRIEEIKLIGKSAADDCSRFSRNLQSIINM